MSEAWGAVTIGQVAEVNPEAAPKWASDHTIRYVDIASVSRFRGIDHEAVKTYAFGEAPGRARRLIRSGDVLVSTVRPNLRAFAQVPSSLDGEVASTGFAVLRANREWILPGYLWAIVGSDSFVYDMVRRCTGSNYPAIRADDVAAHEFQLPPLSAQRRIVDLLQHIDTHLAGLRTEREAAETLLTRLREELSTDAELVLLGELADAGGIQIGPFGSQLHANEYEQSGIPVVMPRDIIQGEVSVSKIKRVSSGTASRLSRHVLLPGDIVFPRRGDLSKRALIKEEQRGWICGTGCIRFRPAVGVDGVQVFESLSGEPATKWLMEHAVGTTMLNLNTEIVSALPVPDPRLGDSPMASACSQLATTTLTLASEVSRLDGVRAAVLSSLLQGHVDIPVRYDELLRGVA